MNAKKIKVMVIDDSALVRRVISQVLEKENDILVMATAADPIFAMSKMKADDWPDVIVLDIEMPRMDGLTFLRQIMSTRPTPVIICSSLAESGARVTLEALQLGAVTIITKPTVGLRNFFADSSNDLAQSIRVAARANLKMLTSPVPRRTAPHVLPAATSTPSARAPLHVAPAAAPAPSVEHFAFEQHRTTDQIIAIGTSTGGTQALESILTQLPATCLGIVVVQHMPERFTAMFAERLNGLCEMEIREAKDGDRVMPGRVLIAPGGRHMQVKRSGAQYIVDVNDGPLVNRHKPSVDVLFRSVAKHVGQNALGIIMTGMGDDGARGMKDMFDAGAQTVAQDEASCVVFGMPKEAIRFGGVRQILPLASMPRVILDYCRQHGH